MSLIQCCCAVCTVTQFVQTCWPSGVSGPTTGFLSGVAVSITDPATGSVVWSGTTDSTGKFVATGLPKSGTTNTVPLNYSYTYTGGTFTRNGIVVACGSTSTVTIDPKSKVIITPVWCGTKPVAACTLTWTGATSGSFVTDDLPTMMTNGFGIIGSIRSAFVGILRPGTYSLAAAASRYDPYSASFTVGTTCANLSVSVPMAFAAGYGCFCGWGAPVKDSIFATIWGGTMALQQRYSSGSPTGVWDTGDFGANVDMTVPAYTAPDGYVSSCVASTQSVPGVSGVKGYSLVLCGSPSFGNGFAFSGDASSFCPSPDNPSSPTNAFMAVSSAAADSTPSNDFNLTFTWTYTQPPPVAGQPPRQWGPWQMVLSE